MNKFVVGLMLAGTLMLTVAPTMGADPYWNYTNQTSYPVQPVKQDRPLLKKILIGGALIGIGFAAGRLTAPKPYPHYSAYPGYGYGPSAYAVHGHGYRHGHHY